MSRPVVTVVSFRLGGSDGVAIEAAKWIWALGELGFDVRTVAGEGTADRIVGGLAITAPRPPARAAVDAALADADLVVVEKSDFQCRVPRFR